MIFLILFLLTLSICGTHYHHIRLKLDRILDFGAVDIHYFDGCQSQIPCSIYDHRYKQWAKQDFQLHNFTTNFTNYAIDNHNYPVFVAINFAMKEHDLEVEDLNSTMKVLDLEMVEP